MKKKLFLFFCLASALLFAPAMKAQTPAFVQAASCPTTGSDTNVVNTITCRFPNPTTAGNLLVFFAQDGENFTAASFSADSGSPTFTNACANYDSPNGLKVTSYYVMNNPGSIRKISVSFTGVSYTNYGQPSIFEYANVATTSALDHAVCGDKTGTSGTSTSVAPGATGTLTSGDLIITWGTEDTGATVTACAPTTHANITWTMRESQIIQPAFQPVCAQYGVYTTTTSFTPAFTMTGASSWNGATLAFKAASAGGVPAYTSPYVLYAQHDNTDSETISTATTQITVIGGELVVALIAGCNSDTTLSTCAYLTGISGGPSGLAQVGGNTALNNSVLQMWEAHNVTPGSYNLTYTFHARPSGGKGITIILLDIAGALTSSPLDANFGGSGVALATAIGTDTTSGGSGGTVNTVSGTPNFSNELIVVATGLAFQSGIALSTPSSNQDFLSAWWDDGTGSSRDPTYYDENNCWGTWKNGTTLTSTTFGWTHDGADYPSFNGVGPWAAAAIAIQPAGGGPSTPAPTKRPQVWNGE